MAFMPPIGPQGQLQAPTSPPPQFTPAQPAQATIGPLAINPGAISGCLFRNTFIWLTNGSRFWFYPVFLGRTSVAGFRWNGFFWMYSGFDLRMIQSFTCF